MPTKKIKPIKAWAVFRKSIQNADYFMDISCSCCDTTEALAIYRKKSDAPSMEFHPDMVLIPVLISPTNKRREK